MWKASRVCAQCSQRSAWRDVDVIELQRQVFFAWDEAMKMGKHLAPWSVVSCDVLTETDDVKSRDALIARDRELAGDVLSVMTVTAARRLFPESADVWGSLERLIEQACAYCSGTGAHPNDAISAATATGGAVFGISRRCLARRMATLAEVAPRTYFQAPRIYLTPMDPKACFRVGNEVLTLIAREPRLILEEPEVVAFANEEARDTLKHVVGIRSRLLQDALIAEEPWLLLPGGLSNTRAEHLAQAWEERGGRAIEDAAMRRVNCSKDANEELQRWLVNTFCDGYG